MRTAVQGVLAVLITYCASNFEWDWKTLLAGMLPAVISPIMALIGEYQDKVSTDNNQ